MLIQLIAPPSGTSYDAASHSSFMPGSWIPLALIMGIFLTRYRVGVELAMQPSLTRDGQYTIVTAAIYGAFSGMFVGRAARLWGLARRPTTIASTTVIA